MDHVSPYIVEALGALFGVAGTVLLAANGRRAGWGFVAYLVSNVAWLAFAWIQGHRWLFGQQIAFMASSLFGIWVWLLKPRVGTFRSVYRAARPYRGPLGAVRLALRCSRA